MTKGNLLLSLILHLLLFSLLYWGSRTDFKEVYAPTSALDIQMVSGGKPRAAVPTTTMRVKRSEEIAANSRSTPRPADAASAPAGGTGNEDALPVPTADYLVTKMPKLSREIRIPYPAEAKLRGIQGEVVMDLLIDAYGKVRHVDVVEGPDPMLNRAAQTAIRQFEFEPAEKDGQKLAVKTRYIYRFILEK